MERNGQIWERHLYTTGEKLELSKCEFAIFKWIADSQDQQILDTSANSHLHIWCSKKNQITLIPQISTTKSYKYVGVQISLDGNMTQQVNDLKDKCIQMATIFNYT
jgi:hypothetical protein